MPLTDRYRRALPWAAYVPPDPARRPHLAARPAAPRRVRTMADPSPRPSRPGRHPLSAVLIGAGLGVALWLLGIVARNFGAVWPVIVLYVVIVALCIWLIWRDRRFARALRALDARRRELGGWENMTDAQKVQWLADVQRVLDRL